MPWKKLILGILASLILIVLGFFLWVRKEEQNEQKKADELYNEKQTA